MIRRAVPGGVARCHALSADVMGCRWDVGGSHSLNAINMDCGQIGVLQDSMFAELARHLANQGAQILLVPLCNEERQSRAIVARHVRPRSKSTS